MTDVPDTIIRSIDLVADYVNNSNVLDEECDRDVQQALQAVCGWLDSVPAAIRYPHLGADQKQEFDA
jgi:hypothetical protein